MNSPPLPPVPQTVPARKPTDYALTTTIVLGVLGLLVIAFVLEPPGSPQSPAVRDQIQQLTGTPRSDVYTTTGAALSHDYDTNEVATDLKINGRAILVSGRVKSIDKDYWNNVVVDLALGNELMPASIKMLDNYASKAAALSEGNEVTIRCKKMRRMVGNPYGSGCVLARANSGLRAARNVR